MQIQVLKENLLKSLSIASKFSSQKAQLPILAHMLVEATKEGIFVSATDLEAGIRLRVAGKVMEAGKAAVPARILSEFVGVLPLGVVDFRVKGGEKLVVKTGGMEGTFQVMPDDEFPQITLPKKEQQLGLIPIEDMNEAWSKLETAVSRDLARPVLTGIRWELGRGRMVATDGFRLTVIELPHLQFGDRKEAVVISGNFWGLAARTLEELAVKSAITAILTTSQQIMFFHDDVILAGRLIEGEFPHYQAILPKGELLTGVFDREILIQAVKGAIIFARDSAQIVRFEFVEKGLRVSAGTQQGGVIGEVSGLVTGKVFVTAFNGKYVLDFLNRAQTSDIAIGLDDPLKPGLFTEVGGVTYRHVIMPIRLRD